MVPKKPEWLPQMSEQVTWALSDCDEPDAQHELRPRLPAHMVSGCVRDRYFRTNLPLFRFRHVHRIDADRLLDEGWQL